MKDRGGSWARVSEFLFQSPYGRASILVSVLVCLGATSGTIRVVGWFRSGGAGGGPWWFGGE